MHLVCSTLQSYSNLNTLPAQATLWRDVGVPGHSFRHNNGGQIYASCQFCQSLASFYLNPRLSVKLEKSQSTYVELCRVFALSRNKEHEVLFGAFPTDVASWNLKFTSPTYVFRCTFDLVTTISLSDMKYFELLSLEIQLSSFSFY